MWDFVIQSVPQTHLASKDAVLSSHLFFRGKFSVTTIMGESCDSGFSPALDAMAKRREVSAILERFSGKFGPVVLFDIAAYSG